CQLRPLTSVGILHRVLQQLLVAIDDLFLFFFKQKTAYEIGLGIPAEPLFRSSTACLRIKSKWKIGRAVQQELLLLVYELNRSGRSEERRVGKECRSRWWW